MQTSRLLSKIHDARRPPMFFRFHSPERQASLSIENYLHCNGTSIPIAKSGVSPKHTPVVEFDENRSMFRLNQTSGFMFARVFDDPILSVDMFSNYGCPTIIQRSSSAARGIDLIQPMDNGSVLFTNSLAFSDPLLYRDPITNQQAIENLLVEKGTIVANIEPKIVFDKTYRAFVSSNFLVIYGSGGCIVADRKTGEHRWTTDEYTSSVSVVERSGGYPLVEVIALVNPYEEQAVFISSTATTADDVFYFPLDAGNVCKDAIPICIVGILENFAGFYVVTVPTKRLDASGENYCEVDDPIGAAVHETLVMYMVH